MHAEIASADDVDWFVIEPSENSAGLYELTVEPRDPTLDLALYLEIPGDEDLPLLLYDLGGPGEKESIPILEIKDRSQRFFVAGKNGTQGAYVIDVRRRLSAGAVAAEPNDHISHATRLVVPGEIQGFYDRPGDRDIFFVSPEDIREQLYSLEIGPIPGINQRVLVYDDPALASPILRLSVSPRQGATLPNIWLGGAEKGLWFVLEAEDDRYDRQRGYRIRLIEHPAPSGSYTIEREPNDRAELAQMLRVGEVIRGYLHEPTDVDRFRVALEVAQPLLEEEPQEIEEPEPTPDDEFATGEDREESRAPIDYWAPVPEKQAPQHILQVRLNPISEHHQIGMRWIPQEEHTEGIRELTPLRSRQPLVFCNHVVSDESFDLEVRSLQMEDGPANRGYDYELTVVNIAQSDGLEIEPNDTRESADRLMMGQGRTGYISSEGDRDFYAFVVEAPAEPTAALLDDGLVVGEGEDDSRRVQIRLRGNSLNLAFQLLDDEGGLVADVNRTGPGADEEITMDLPSGLYYVVVSATRGHSCEPYRISVEMP